MSAVAPRRNGEPRDNQKPDGWERTRLGVVIPLCVVVAVAIVCIIVAALTSAHRADEVALENEKHLLTRAFANHGDWSLRRLRNIITHDSSYRGIDVDGPSNLSQAWLSRWLEPMRDHDLVWVIGSSDQLVYGQIGRHHGDIQMPQTAFAFLGPTIDYLRGRTGLPDRVARLIGRNPAKSKIGVPDTVLMQMFLGRLAVISAVPLPNTQGNAPDMPVPLVLSARFLEDTLLANVSSQLRLENLRMVSARVTPEGDHVFDITDAKGDPIVRFAWTPKRPGAEILNSVFPFLGIALAGFVLLAGMVLRFMRRTAETITAGENRLRYLALHDPLCGLPNRNYFSDRLEATIAAVRQGGPPAAVLYIDLDHFKDVNDTLGHPVGDELIRATSRAACPAPCAMTIWSPASAATSSPSSRRYQQTTPCCLASLTASSRC